MARACWSSCAVLVQIRLEDPGQYQSIVDAEWNIIYQKLDQCAASGAKIVLSRLAIGDLGTQYFADRDIFCAGRVSFFCLCSLHEPLASGELPEQSFTAIHHAWCFRHSHVAPGT